MLDLSKADIPKKVFNHEVVVMDDLKKTDPDMFEEGTARMKHKVFEEKVRPFKYIYVRKDKNSLTFNLAKEGQPGVNLKTAIQCLVYLMDDEE